MDPDQVFSIAEEIRLAVAPVFLLTALAALSTLLSQRLTRCIDRVRVLAGSRQDASGQTAQGVLRRRLRVIQWSIRFSISAAILTCFVVVAIFASDTLLGDLATVGNIDIDGEPATIAHLDILRHRPLRQRESFRPAGQILRRTYRPSCALVIAI